MNKSLKYILLIIGIFIRFYSNAQCDVTIGTSSTGICEGAAIQFTETFNSGAAFSRTWDFGDGSAIVSNPTPNHLYSIAGNYTVTLVSTCQSLEIVTVTTAINVYEKPLVDFSMNSTVVCALTDTVCFINNSTTGSGYSYNWNFGSTVQEPCYSYNTPGTFAVRLEVFSDHGCVNELTHNDSISVKAAPNPGFLPDNNVDCHPMNVNFANTTADFAAIAIWEWDFGNSITSLQPNPLTQTYTNPGTFFISLKATDTLGCFNTTTQAIIAKETPDANFTINSPVCVNDPTMVNYTGITDPATATFTWDFSSGAASPGTGEGPHDVTWSNSGVKKVKLEMTKNGCTAKDSTFINVNPLPLGQIFTTAINDSICGGQNVDFSASPIYYSNYQFYVNNVLVKSGSSHVYSSTTLTDQDTVTVSFTDGNGCTNFATDSAIISVKTIPVVTLTSSDADDIICINEAINLTANPSIYDSYKFFNNFYLLQNSISDTYNYIGADNLNNISVVAVENGCNSAPSNAIHTEVIDSLKAPQVNCGNTTLGTIEFMWDAVNNSSGYEVSVNGDAYINPSSGLTGLTHELTGVSPSTSDTIVVRALSGVPCNLGYISDTAICFSNPCTAVTYNVIPDTVLCEEDSVELFIINVSTNSFSVSWDGEPLGSSLFYWHQGLADKTITVSLLDSNQLACPRVEKDIFVDVRERESINVIASASNDTICSGDVIVFETLPTNLSGYEFYKNGISLLQSGANPYFTTSNWDNGDFMKVIGLKEGCYASSFSTATVAVRDPLEIPQVVCGSTNNNSIEFVWDDIQYATGYEVIIDGAPVTIPSSGSNGLIQTITGLTAGDAITLQVIAKGADSPCGDSEISLPTTCYAIPCNPILFDLISGIEVCKGEAVTLNITNASPDAYGLSWNNGAVVDAGPNTFTPTSDTILTVSLIDSSQLACVAPSKYVVVTVNDIPSVTITSSAVNDTICKFDMTNYSAAPIGYDSYNFYQGFLSLQESGLNNYSTATWIDGDSIFVVATDNGCSSLPSNVITTHIVEPLNVPQANCGVTSLSTIDFQWDPIAGAQGYEVSIDGTSYTMPSSGNFGLTHSITGLSAGDSATIQVLALGLDPCGNSSASISMECFAVDCYLIDFDKSNDTIVCANENLEFSIDNLTTSNYSVCWAQETPDASSVYSITSTVDTVISIKFSDFDQPLCPSVIKYISVGVNPIPLVSLTSSSINDSICEDDFLFFSANPAGYDNYEFISGFETIQNGANPGYITTTWENGDSILVVATDFGCVSSESGKIYTNVSQKLNTPVANCGTTSNSEIEFSWDAIAGATGYEISIDGATFETPNSGLSHSLTGLTPGDSKTISVIALGNTACGNSEISLPTTCFAIPCAPITFDVSNNPTICDGDIVTLIISNASPISYGISWNGGVVSSDTTVIFSPNADTVVVVSMIDSAQLACPAPIKYINVTVNTVPSVTITSNAINDTICKNDIVSFTVSSAGYDNYEFFNGFLSLQNSSNHIYSTNSWENGDSIFVVAKNNGCSSLSSNVIKTNVVKPLITPQANCGSSTTSSIEFVWDAIPEAQGYEVSVDGMNYIVPSDGNFGLSHTLTGLGLGDSANIQVVALGVDPCGNSNPSISTECFAYNCNLINFDKSNDVVVCTGENKEFEISNLTASNYEVSWAQQAAGASSSYSIIPFSDTIISVELIDLDQPLCQSVVKYITVEVNPIPLVSVVSSITNDSICEGDFLFFTANPMGYDNYSFVSGFEILQNTANPVFITSNWEDGDSLLVIASDLGCSSLATSKIYTTVSQKLTTPVANCDSTSNTEIVFSWDTILGASNYEVSIDGASFVTSNASFSHLLTGLTPGSSKNISVRAIGNTACGNSEISAPTTCYAIPCSPITFDKGNDVTVCNGDSATLNILNVSALNYGVSWGTEPISDKTSITFLPTTDTAVSVLLLDSAQLACPSPLKYINVTVNPIPLVSITSNASNDTVCKNDMVSFTSSIASYDNYEFFKGYLSLQNSSNYIYSSNSWESGDSIFVIATDKGCSSLPSNIIKTFTVEPLNTPQVNCGNTTTNSIEFVWDAIDGATGYEVSVSGSPYIVPSSGASGLSHLINGLSSGVDSTIKVVALGDLPCGMSQVSTLATCASINCNAVNFSIIPAMTVCENETITLTANVTVATNYTLSWAGESAGTSNTYAINIVEDTIVKIVLADLDQPVCPPISKNVVITMNPTPIVSITSSLLNDSICEADNFQIVVNPPGYDKYQFFDGATLLLDSVYHALNVNNIIVHSEIFVSVTDRGCHFISDTISTEVISLPTVGLSSSLPTDTVCGNDSVVFLALPDGFAQYAFFINDSLVQDSIINAFTANQLLTGDSVSVNVTNSYGCVSNTNNSHVMEVRPIPSISLTSSDADNSICFEENISFTASPSNFVNYLFYNVDTVISASVTEIYSTSNLPDSNKIFVIGIDSFGCYSGSSDTIITENRPIPTTSLSVDTFITCFGNSATIFVKDTVYLGTTFLWNTGSILDSIVVSPNIQTNYWVNATLNNCTSPADSVVVIVENETPVVNAGTDITICAGDSAELTALGAFRYQWDLREGMPENDILKTTLKVSPYETQVYVVTGYYMACFAKDSILITVDKCLSDLTGPIPQIISPNGDGANDLWIIPDVGYFLNNKLAIYNRWGNLVFSEDGYQGTWNGFSMKGEKLPDATYYYVLDLGNGKDPYTGFIMIHR